jgi:hypothetical protein
MYRLEIQKAFSVHTKWINLWGVPLELNTLPHNIENIGETNVMKNNTIILNNALTMLENIFIVPIELMNE